MSCDGTGSTEKIPAYGLNFSQPLGNRAFTFYSLDRVGGGRRVDRGRGRIIPVLFIKMLTQCVAFNNSYSQTRDSCN